MKKLVNLEMQNLQPRRPVLAGILLIRIDLLGYLPASPCAEHERTPSPYAAGCVFARVFSQCAARSKFQLRIIAKKPAKPAVLGHRCGVRCPESRQELLLGAFHFPVKFWLSDVVRTLPFG